MGVIGASVIAVALASGTNAAARMDITLQAGPETKAATVAALARVLQAMPAVRMQAVVVPGQANTMTAAVRVGDRVRWANEAAVYAAFELAGVSHVTLTRPPK
jgi:hypothetical protein